MKPFVNVLVGMQCIVISIADNKCSMSPIFYTENHHHSSPIHVAHGHATFPIQTPRVSFGARTGSESSQEPAHCAANAGSESRTA